MDTEASGRLADPAAFPDVNLGVGVLVYGDVQINPGALIGDYSIIGVPSVDDIANPNGHLMTRIGHGVVTGSHCIIHSGARLGARVHLDDRCTVGPESEIGEDSRILYGAQIHWQVKVGRNCVVGGFCCDRANVGDGSIMLGKLIHRLEDFRASWDDVEEPSPCIQDEVVVGYDALVIGGVVVRSKAYIAAGAIVTKDIPSGFIAVGSSQYPMEEWKETRRRTRRRRRHGQSKK